MDSQRQLAVFRAAVKDILRKKGLRFDKSSVREIGREVKEFNEVSNLNPPISIDEFCEIFGELLRELTEEHFAMMTATAARMRTKTTGGPLLGQAFYNQNADGHRQ